MKRWKKDIFARLFWSNKWLMAAGILLSYIQTQVLVTGNKKLSGAIDLMLEGNGNAGMDAAFIGWLLLLAAFGFAAAYGANQCAAYFAVRMQAQFRELAGKKIPWLEYAYFDGNDSASVMNRLVSDTGVVSLYYSEVLPAVVGTVITTVIILGSMWKMDWKLVLSFLLVFPPVLLLSDYAGRRIAGLQKKHLQLWDEVNEIAYDNVQGIVVGRSYGLYPLMKKRVEDANRRILKFEFQRNRLSAIPWNLYHVVQWLPNLLFGIMTLYRVVEGGTFRGDHDIFYPDDGPGGTPFGGIAAASAGSKERPPVQAASVGADGTARGVGRGAVCPNRGEWESVRRKRGKQ